MNRHIFANSKPKLGVIVTTINRRLVASEASPVGPWNPGDAKRLVKQAISKKNAQ
ncbi:MAG TPA: hypothetical protein VMF06_19450 [Candidatus Limnocylindria bacterium]|nr:hypothetical protein [Candidatus Limnocylindria bacterium]